MDYVALGLAGTIDEDIPATNTAANQQFTEQLVDNWIGTDPCEENEGTYGWDSSVVAQNPTVTPEMLSYACRNHPVVRTDPVPFYQQVKAVLSKDPTRAPALPAPCSPGMFFRLESGSSWDIADLAGYEVQKHYLPPLCLTCDPSKTYGLVVSEYEIKRPDDREVVINRPFQQGTWDYTTYHGASSIEMTIEAYTRDPSTTALPPWIPQNLSISELRDAVYKFLTPFQRSRLVFREHGENVEKVAVFRKEDVSCKINSANSAKIDLSLKIPAGNITSYRVRKIHLMPPAVLAQFPTLGINKGVILNQGYSPADWRLEVFGGFSQINFRVWSPDWGYKNPLDWYGNKPITAPDFNIEACNYRIFQINSDVAPMERALILSRSRSVVAIEGNATLPTYGQVKRNLYTNVNPDSRWFQIEPGYFYIEYSVSLTAAGRAMYAAMRDNPPARYSDAQVLAGVNYYPQMALWTTDQGEGTLDPANPFDYPAHWRDENLGSLAEAANQPRPGYPLDVNDPRYPVWGVDIGLSGSAFLSWRDTW